MSNKIVLGGHYESCPHGWLCLGEQDQDITKRLIFADNSVEIMFLEHINEHVTIIENISFLKEALRVLKHGGVLRIAMPCIDKMIELKNNALGKHYSLVQTRHYYPNEDAALKELGLEGIIEEPIAFMMDSLFKGHHHKFVWTSELFKKVVEKIGFSEVYICEPGETSFNPEYCLERTIRGVDPEYVLKEFGVIKFDPETMVIEAKK